ncbi:MAG: hypothetical protein KDA84_12865, partial [Planctomycetaceae bacterium]|nr:hypothetical protein [Planctomycetaceae bacterium]
MFDWMTELFGISKKSSKQSKAIRRRKAGLNSLGKRPDSLEERLLLAADLGLIGEAFSHDFFVNLQDEIDSSVLSAPAPLVSGQLAESLGGDGFLGRIDQLLDGFLAETQTPTLDDVTQALIDRLDTLIIAPASGPEIAVLGDDGADEIHFQLRLGGSETRLLDLDLALGNDPVIAALLGYQDQVNAQIDWALDLTFGVTETEFFIDMGAANELKIDVSATLASDFEGKGRVGVFISELEAGTAPSFFTGTYQVDLRQNQGETRLTLGNDGFTDLATTGRLSGTGEANLATYNSFLPEFLSGGSSAVFNIAVDADAQITYQLSNVLTDVFDASGEQIKDFGPSPTIRFTNVMLDLGTFYNDFIRPIVEETQDALTDLEPVVDFLTEPVPLLDKLIPSKPTVLDLAILAAGNKETLKTSLEATKAAVEVIDAILDFDLSITETSQKVQPLGTFSAKAMRSFGTSSEPSGMDPMNTAKKAEITESNPNTNAADEASESSQVSRDFKASLGGRIIFPLLQDPSNVFKLLVGDITPQLFEAAIDFDMSFTFSYAIPLFKGLINAELELNLGASVDLAFGYDAYGVNLMNGAADFTNETTLHDSVLAAAPLLLDGFYFSDHNPKHVADGFPNISTVTSDTKEKPEATINASLGLGVSIGPSLKVLEFKAGVIGTFGANILFDFNDFPEPLPQSQWEDPTVREWPDEIHNSDFDTSTFEYDGRVRFYEFAMAANANPVSIFNTSGELVVGLKAFVKASVGFGSFSFTLDDQTFTIFEAIIYQFDIFTLDDLSVLRGEVINPPKLGEVDNNGELKLFIGETAYRRENSNSDRSGIDDIVDERFNIRSVGPTDPTNPAA